MTKPCVLRMLNALDKNDSDDFDKTMLRTLRRRYEDKSLSEADMLWINHEYKAKHQDASPTKDRATLSKRNV
jgi:hypothetical protein